MPLPTVPILRLKPGVRLEPYYLDLDVDCRLLFAGDRHRQLLRTYVEIIHRMSQKRDRSAVAKYLRESDEIRHFYDIEDNADAVGVVLRDDIFRQPASIDELEFEIAVSDGHRQVRYPLPLSRFAAVGRLLPLLAGDTLERDVNDRLQQDLSGDALSWTEDFLTRIDGDGFLERADAPAPNYFLASALRPRVTFVAHTSILVQSSNTAVLMDPLFPRGSVMPHEAYGVTRLNLGAICLSHSHWDHCDVATLLRFNKRMPILIPRMQQPTIFNPPVRPMLQLLGFEDVREVEHWQAQRIGDIEIIPVPFHGEQDEPDAEIDHYTYVIRTGGLCLYGGVDAFKDTFGDMRADLHRVRQEYAPALAFLPVSEMKYSYIHGGVNGYCRRVDTSMLDKVFQYTAGPDAAVEWVKLLNASWVVPYATFTFNRSTPAPQVLDFSREMSKAGLQDRLIALRPLDSLESNDLTKRGSATLRRQYLNQWLRATTAVHRTERRLRKNLVYRGLKKLLRVSKPAPEVHHH